MQHVSEYKKIGLSLLLVTAMSIVFFTTVTTFAQAEETVTNASTTEEVEDETEEANTDSADEAKRAEMKKQIESLRAAIAEKKAAFLIVKEEYKAEKKAEFKIDKEEFMASLEGLTEDEKRAAMMEFIADIKAQIELKKAEFTEKKVEFKEQRAEEKDAFKASLEGLSRDEKIALILERVATIKKQIEEQSGDDSEQESEDEDADEVEDESESEDEDEDESDEDDDETTE